MISKIKENDWITTKQNPDTQVEVLSVGDPLYCADVNGNGIEVRRDDVLTCGVRVIKDIHNKWGKF